MASFDWRSAAVSSPVTVDGALATSTIPVTSMFTETIAATAVNGGAAGTTRDLGATNFVEGSFIRPHCVVVAFSNAGGTVNMLASLRMRIQWSRDGSTWYDACLPGSTTPALATVTTTAAVQIAYCRAMILGRYYRWVFNNGSTAATPVMTTIIHAQPCNLF